jgi:hypothetical protein
MSRPKSEPKLLPNTRLEPYFQTSPFSANRFKLKLFHHNIFAEWVEVAIMLFNCIGKFSVPISVGTSAILKGFPWPPSVRPVEMRDNTSIRQRRLRSQISDWTFTHESRNSFLQKTSLSSPQISKYYSYVLCLWRQCKASDIHCYWNTLISILMPF